MTAYEIRKAEAYEKALERQAAAWRMVEQHKPSMYSTGWRYAMVPVAGVILGALTIAMVLGPFVLWAWIAR